MHRALGARRARRVRRAAQAKLFGEKMAQRFEEKCAEKSRRGTLYGVAAGLLRRVFAVEVLVCVHYAGKLCLVEIAGGGCGHQADH